MLDIPLPERPFDRATSPGTLRTIPGKPIRFRKSRAPMTKFKFRYKSRTITVSAYSWTGAMEKANHRLPLAGGAWFGDKAPNCYVWVEGNFCD